MARPLKKGCDYFSHDADMRNHRKIKAIRTTFGLNGYAIWGMFLEYLTSSEDNGFVFSDMELELISGDFGVSVTEIRSVLNYCIRIELLFDNNGILYSKSLNERLKQVYDKRKSDKSRTESQKRENGKFSKSTDGTVVSATEIPKGTVVSVVEMPQSKVKESKDITYTLLPNGNLDFNTLRNYYNSTLIKFLIQVFEEKKAESIEEIKSFEMIVLEMNKVWAKHKPNYTFLNEADYPALLQIAYLIAQVKKFNKHSVVKDPFVADEVTQSFDKIAEFLVKTSDKYLFKLTLKQIAHPNNFQTIFEAMKELRPIEKAKELEKKRIQPEDYFTK